MDTVDFKEELWKHVDIESNEEAQHIIALLDNLFEVWKLEDHPIPWQKVEPSLLLRKAGSPYSVITYISNHPRNYVDLIANYMADDPHLAKITKIIPLSKLLAILAIRESEVGNFESVREALREIGHAQYREKLKKLLPDAALGIEARKSKFNFRKAIEGLAKGRNIGTEKNKQHADDMRTLWRQTSADLYKHPETALWILDKHVEFIQKQSFGTMKNGKPYAARTIKDAIKGVKSEIQKNSPST